MRGQRTRDLKPPPVGLWQCLDGGDGDISPFVHSDVIENLSVIFSGGVAPN